MSTPIRHRPLARLAERIFELLEEAEAESSRESQREDGGNPWVKGFVAGEISAYRKIIETLP
jgi:hypothetical protein